MPRTLSEILIDADNAKRPTELVNAWNELVRDKHSYPLVELDYAKEHINELAPKFEKEYGLVIEIL